MSTIQILAVIGGLTVILTTAARIPTALAEFLQACILVATSARELHSAITKHSPRGDFRKTESPKPPRAPYGGASCRTANPAVSEPADRDSTVRTSQKSQANAHDPQFGGWYPFR